MKKTLFAIGTTLTLLFFGTSLSAQNNCSDNGLIGKARGAAADCINNYTSQGYDIVAGVETTGICFASGSLRKVVFCATVKCNTHRCPPVLGASIATVYFDCDNNVTSIECETSSQ